MAVGRPNRRHDIRAPLSEANAVVVLFAGALGDFLLVLPSLRRLRARHHAARYLLAVRTPLVWLAERAALADAVVALDDRAMAQFLGGDPPPPWWPSTPQLYSWFGSDDPSLRDRLRASAHGAEFHRVVRGAGPVHAAAEYARAVGWDAAWDELVAAASLASPQARAVPADPLLVVHRGAGAPAKRWRADGYAEVAAWWRAARGPVVELLGPAEHEEAPLPGARPLREQPLRSVVEALGAAHVYLGNDSGPSHLAGALGTSGVVLFGPTEPTRWRPLSARLDVLRAAPPSRHADAFHDPPPDVVIERLSASLP
jgi:ADP-heptose:LPS heptosyltransferase